MVVVVVVAVVEVTVVELMVAVAVAVAAAAAAAAAVVVVVVAAAEAKLEAVVKAADLSRKMDTVVPWGLGFCRGTGGSKNCSLFVVLSIWSSQPTALHCQFKCRLLQHLHRLLNILLAIINNTTSTTNNGQNHNSIFVFEHLNISCPSKCSPSHDHGQYHHDMNMVINFSITRPAALLLHTCRSNILSLECRRA